jgi:feruloyl esterase
MSIFLKMYRITVCTSIFFITCTQAQTSITDNISACIPCSTLKELRLPDVSITEAVEVKPDLSGQMNKDLPHCRIKGVIGKEINFELLLPDAWNGRFAMGGGGGFVGSIQNGARFSLNQGYATSGTDTGHKGNGIKADWALNNMERQVNFGHMAIHRTAEVSKVLIYNYYCKNPEYSYFFGCSRGGGQAMMEAQRYPADFDGIVAMAPAFNWPEIAAEFIRNMQALYPDPEDLEHPVLTTENLKVLRGVILNACDDIDGLKDNIITDPRDCNLNLNDLPLCPDELPGNDCLTKKQIEAIRTVYEGVVIDGTEVYPGFPFGGEDANGGWIHWITGPAPSLKPLNFPSLQYGFGTEIYKYLIYNDPEWDYSAYDYSNFFKDTEYAASYLNAASLDYSEFRENNGKIILVHGWEDAALSAFATIDHFESVNKSDPESDKYMKLYLLPGVYHCGGGPGPSQADWLTIIRDWVEGGNIPDRIVVTKENNGEVVMSRPVYPYPRKAIYDGIGEPDIESSFK